MDIYTNSTEETDKNVKFIDLCFTDPLGSFHHMQYLAQNLDNKDHVAFDGSSIKLFEEINHSDLLLIFDKSTTIIDPMAKYPTLQVICDIEKDGGIEYTRDPRTIAKKAIEYMRSTGIADKTLFGAEPEFFLFDGISYRLDNGNIAFTVHDEEAPWTSDNIKSRFTNNYKSNYPIQKPMDTTSDIRAEMMIKMEMMNLQPEKHHHEVGVCQVELGFVAQSLVKCADTIQRYKYIVKNVADKNNKVASFMAKIFHDDNGNGMHIHQSLWKEGKPLFYSDTNSLDINPKYKLSDIALYYIGGIMKHAGSLTAFCNPTTNSYKRLQPGFEAPVNIAYSCGNRSVAIRIPDYDNNEPCAKRMEYRTPDPMGNPYLVLAANLMAGLDGIINKIHPGSICEDDLYEAENSEKYPKIPESLDEALNCLERDHDYLTVSNVFSKDFITKYINYKKDEIKELRRYPHPAEFKLYGHI